MSDRTLPEKQVQQLQAAYTLARARLEMLRYEEEDIKCKIVREQQAIEDLSRDLRSAKTVLEMLRTAAPGLVDPRNVRLFDLIDYSDSVIVKAWLADGARFYVADVMRKDVMDHLHPFDLVIDLTNRTHSMELIERCVEKNVHYINTSMEAAGSTKEHIEAGLDTYERSYLKTHRDLKDLHRTGGATILVEMGMNPGLVSLMTKLALRKMAVDAKLPVSRKTGSALFSYLAENLGVQSIHISETDSTDWRGGPSTGRPAVFYNTWCCNAFNDEYSHTSEFSFGSHEKARGRKRTVLPLQELDDVVVDLEVPAGDIYTDSYVPGERFIGCIIPHGEGLSIARYLRTNTYHPTVHYVYRWSPITQQCLAAPRHADRIGFTFPKSHVMNNIDDDLTGVDTVGVLMLRKNKLAYWCGSILDNTDTTMSGTLQQVGVGILVGLMHILQHPTQSIVFPEAVDETLLLHFRDLLGELYCGPVPYTRCTQFRLKTKRDFDAQFE